jgi:hypothetical protein
VTFGEDGRGGLRGAAHRDETVLVADGAVIREPVDLVARRVCADLGDDDLDLVRLRLLREDGAEGLRVDVGERAAGHVRAVVCVPAKVGVPDPCLSQVFELVVFPDGRERDPVVDLTDLVQRGRGVLRDEQDAVGVGEHDDAATAGDALARIVRAVLHDLLG